MVDAMVVWRNSVIDGVGIVARAPNKKTLPHIPFSPHRTRLPTSRRQNWRRQDVWPIRCLISQRVELTNTRSLRLYNAARTFFSPIRNESTSLSRLTQKAFNISHKSTSCSLWLSPEVSTSCPAVPLYLFLCTVPSEGSHMCCPLPPPKAHSP